MLISSLNRIIAENFLPHWWKDLKTTLTTDKYVDTENIHRFDPASEFFGGGGDAGRWLGKASYSPPSENQRAFNTGIKQGAYGKVKIHKHNKLSQLVRIDEVFSAIWLKFGAKMPNKIEKTNADPDLLFCDLFLGKVSRSFAAVIRQLPKGLCSDILVFYLVLRALDTIEDDMEAFKGQENVKINHLNTFHSVALYTKGWNMKNVGEGDEEEFLSNFDKCGNVFRSLRKDSQTIIADIAKRMGEGMASFVAKDLGQGTVSIEDYNMYCHYVAGLVGEGLSKLFTCSGYESNEVADVSETLANTMGLFLQKTNIIRDYLEDYVDGRAWWPQEVWKQYSVSGSLGDFTVYDNKEHALHCLNHLITDALTCIPDCMEYMKLLKTEEVFRFCAIPQVMAIATLRDLYNNHNVFTGVVKIRKGLVAKLILDTKTPAGLHKWFNFMAKDILSRVPEDDPNKEKTKEICNKVIRITSSYAHKGLIDTYATALQVFAPIGIALSVQYFYADYNMFGFSLPLYSIRGQLAFAAFGLLSTFSLLYSLFPVREPLKRADP